MGDRNDPGPADQAYGRFEAYDAVGLRRADDRAVGLGPDGNRTQIGSHRRRRSRRGATGGAVERMGVTGQPATAGPAAGRAFAAEIGPLGEIGFPQDQGPSFTQPLHQEGILQSDRAFQCQRAGRGRHTVEGIDIVFDEHGDAMQWATNFSRFAFRIQAFGDDERVRIEFDNRVDPILTLINHGNTTQVHLGELPRRQLAGGHLLSQFCEGPLFHLAPATCNKTFQLGDQ